MTSEAMDELDALTCTICGYSLHMLDRGGVCPECGRSVAHSIEAIRRREARFGPPLRAHSAAWLRVAGFGFFTFLLGGGCILMGDVLTRSSTRWWFVTIGQTISIAGVWLLTIRPIEPKRRAEMLRWATRIALTIWLIANAISSIGMAVYDRYIGGDARLWIALWSCAAGSLSGYLYLAHLAGRMRRLLVRRVFLMLSAIAILMIFGLIKTAKGTYDPKLLGLTLPWPVFPFAGQAEDLLSIRSVFNYAVAGQISWRVVLMGIVPVSIMSMSSITALLWYGMILLGTASRRAEREREGGES